MPDFYLQHLQQHRQRGLLVLAGSRSWAQQRAMHYLQNLQPSQCLWLADVAPALTGVRHQRTRDIPAYLGTQCATLVFDAHDGFAPNAFCAAADTLAGGGVLLLLVPELSLWPLQPDKDFSAACVAADSDIAHASPSRFLQRLLRYLHESLAENSFARLITEACVEKNLTPLAVQHHGSEPVQASVSQQQVIAALHRAIEGRAHRPLVLSAARGRGKTTTLGMALADWLVSAQTKQFSAPSPAALSRILVTAPLRSAVAAAFHIIEQQTGVREHDGRWCLGNAVIEFLPVDRLVSETPAAQALVIDEAAAFPLPVLQQLLQHYPRCIFSTTTVGYEGAGRGFALRFCRLLDHYTPQWRRASLVEPLRWASNDPLENWMQRCFLLADSVPAEAFADYRAAEKKSYSPEHISHQFVDRDTLVNDEQLLSAVFRLLVDAHYRTEPDDLRYLLDAPDVQVCISRCGDDVLAAAVITAENPLPDNTIARIREQRHRPRGHLLAQTLALQEGFYQALGMSAWRIVRIAVQPAQQRCGIGRQLLAFIVQAARHRCVDYCASSFAVDGAVLGFWLQAGFSPWRIGLQRDHVTASYAALLAMPISMPAQHLQSQLQQRLAHNLALLLSQYWQTLDVEIVLLLLRQLPVTIPLAENERQQVQDYLRAAIAYDAAWLALQRALLITLPQCPKTCAQQFASLPIRRIFQCWSWSTLASQYHCTGRKQVEQQLRESLQKLLVDFM